MTNRPPFPSAIDSTLISHWKACRRKTLLESFEHWKPRTRSVHLHAGAAYARGLEVARLVFYRDGEPEHIALSAGLQALVEAYGDFECPEDSAKSLPRMMGALEYYFSQYPLAHDSARPATLPGGRLGIEFSFLEPIDIPHPETGDPILYSGRFDMIAEYAGGLFGEDDKTTSSLGASWARQWDLRSQFTSYVWGARRAGIHLDGFLVRGISILKTKYETQQAITYRGQWIVDEWYEGMLAEVRDMIEAWRSGVWRPNLDESCNAYGGCAFKKVCMTPAADRDRWLRMDFERRRWDPVTRVETALAE